MSGAAEVQPSQLQQDVADTLRRLNVSITEEVLDPATGYTVDIKVNPFSLTRIPQAALAAAAAVGDSSSMLTFAAAYPKLVVEVDGPFHFRGRTDSPLGSTILKRRHLRANGYKLVTVPYWEWDTLKGADEKSTYLLSCLLASDVPDE